jgi:hypothetical protein
MPDEMLMNDDKMDEIIAMLKAIAATIDAILAIMAREIPEEMPK